MTFLYFLVSFILGIILFFAVFLLTFIVVRLLWFGLSMLRGKPVIPDRIALMWCLPAGFVSTYVVMMMLMKTREYFGITSIWCVVVVMILLFIGQIQYIGQRDRMYRTNDVLPVGWPGRFNAIAANVIMRGEFARYYTILVEGYPDGLTQDGTPIERATWEYIKGFMLQVSGSTLYGMILGVLIFWWRSR